MPAEPSASAPVGPPLTVEEVTRLVATASPAIRLEVDNRPNGKGRYLVAARPIKAGEPFLSERPLFRGCVDGAHSRRVYQETFVALLDEVEGDSEEEGDPSEDRLHPGSPLLDCVAAVLLERRKALQSTEEPERARATLRLRQLASLCRSARQDAMADGCAADICGVLRPEFREMACERDVFDLVQTLSSNRFGGSLNQLDLMFAGSMFEHSCKPSCFVASWLGARQSDPSEVCFRALRDVAEGEALSIDYLQMPESYLPTRERQEVLSRWGFLCPCPRCTDMPDTTRAFLCDKCGAPELCPTQPAEHWWLSGGVPTAVVPAATPTLKCRACGAEADPLYPARCLAAEARAAPSEAKAAAGEQPAEAPAPVAEEAAEAAADSEKPSAEGDLASTAASSESTAEEGARDTRLLSRNHHAVFEVLWATIMLGWGEEVEDGAAYAAALETLISNLARLYTELYGDARHPQLLDLYHAMAELHISDLETQRHFLELERAVIERFYPEEIQKQDEEIMKLCTGRGRPTFPFAPAASGTPDLSAMD